MKPELRDNPLYVEEQAKGVPRELSAFSSSRDFKRTLSIYTRISYFCALFVLRHASCVLHQHDCLPIQTSISSSRPLLSSAHDFIIIFDLVLCEGILAYTDKIYALRYTTVYCYCHRHILAYLVHEAPMEHQTYRFRLDLGSAQIGCSLFIFPHSS